MQQKYKETIIVELKNIDPPKQFPAFEIVIPAIVSIIVSFGLKFWMSKKEKIEIETLQRQIKNLVDRKETEDMKLSSEVDKLKEEINVLKKHYQPLVFDVLNRVSNELLPRKVKLLDDLVKIKNDFFTYENTFFEGRSNISDKSDHYAEIARNINPLIIEDFVKNIKQRAYCFNSIIVAKINNLDQEFTKLKDFESQQTSMDKPERHVDADTCIDQIKILFNEIIDLVREDLHIDNTYIADFLKRYKEI